MAPPVVCVTCWKKSNEGGPATGMPGTLSGADAGLLGKYDINLEQAATRYWFAQHALTLGLAYSSRATLTRPADSSEILHTIRTCQ